jgi:hypothetical protein
MFNIQNPNPIQQNQGRAYKMGNAAAKARDRKKLLTPSERALADLIRYAQQRDEGSPRGSPRGSQRSSPRKAKTAYESYAPEPQQSVLMRNPAVEAALAPTSEEVALMDTPVCVDDAEDVMPHSLSPLVQALKNMLRRITVSKHAISNAVVKIQALVESKYRQAAALDAIADAIRRNDTVQTIFLDALNASDAISHLQQKLGTCNVAMQEAKVQLERWTKAAEDAQPRAMSSLLNNMRDDRTPNVDAAESEAEADEAESDPQVLKGGEVFMGADIAKAPKGAVCAPNVESLPAVQWFVDALVESCKALLRMRILLETVRKTLALAEKDAKRAGLSVAIILNEAVPSSSSSIEKIAGVLDGIDASMLILFARGLHDCFAGLSEITLLVKDAQQVAHAVSDLSYVPVDSPELLLQLRDINAATADAIGTGLPEDVLQRLRERVEKLSGRPVSTVPDEDATRGFEEDGSDASSRASSTASSTASSMASSLQFDPEGGLVPALRVSGGTGRDDDDPLFNASVLGSQLSEIDEESF